MSSDPKIYGVIFEHKCEQPLMIESPPLTYEKAHERMDLMRKNPDIIRVAIFKIIHETGNETLIEKESENV